MELRADVAIEAPPRAAWVVLGERFGSIGEWATLITASSLDGEPRAGAVRTCDTARFGPIPAGTIKERLIAFDPEAMTLVYETVEGMPGFIGQAINRWSVHAAGDDCCVVRSHATLVLRGPIALLGFLVARRFSADGARVLEELRYQVENGRPHPRKAAAGTAPGS